MDELEQKCRDHFGISDSAGRGLNAPAGTCVNDQELRFILFLLEVASGLELLGPENDINGFRRMPVSVIIHGIRQRMKATYQE
jgi:hypothetical protein